MRLCSLRVVRSGSVRRWLGAASLWGGRFAVWSEAHASEALLSEVARGTALLRSADRSTKVLNESASLLERGADIAVSAFGAQSEASARAEFALCVAWHAAQRFAKCEKRAKTLLQHLDPASPVDRFQLRVMRADCLRQLNRIDEAMQACQVEESDSVEQKLEMLARQAWLARVGSKGKEPPHALLNEAARLSESLEKQTLSLAKYSAVILALQGLISLESGQWEQALERGQKGQQVIQQFRKLAGDAKALTAELGDLLTLQGRALLAGKNYLRAEELLDEALAQYEDDHARAAEAMLALGQLFRETRSDMYAEGMYRKLLSVIARNPGEVNAENVREAYDKYAWFLRHAKRIPEAEEIEQDVFTIVVLAAAIVYHPPPYIFGPSIFLHDPVYAPVSTEENFLIDTNGSTIPSHLIGGTFFRNGPNPVVKSVPYHWFDGDGHVFAVSFRENSLVLRNRWIRTSLLETRNRTQTMWSFLSELQYPARVIRALLRMAYSSFTGENLEATTGNTAFVFHENRLLCLMEAARPIEIDPITLKTKQMFSFDGMKSSFTAHPKFDPVAKELMSFGWIPPSNSIHFYTHKGDKLVFSDRIPFEGPLPRMPHDFACSEQYCVFFDSTSIRMDPIRLLGFSPRDTVPARMVYFPRKSRGTRSVAVDNGSIVHFGNAWEEGDELVVMGCRSNETVLYFDLEREDRYLPYLYEYRINLVSNKVSERYLLDQNGAKIAGEFPTVHPGLATRATRFVYMMKLDRGGVAKSGGMFKYDRQLGISTSFDYCETCFGQEPRFVPSMPDGSGREDEGSIVTFVLDTRTGMSSLLIVDALTMKQTASISLGTRVPMGFHTLFLSARDLEGVKSK